MGALLSFFNQELPTDVIVEFDKVEAPKDPKEAELYNSAIELLSQASSVITLIDGYKGNADLIRQAMANQNSEAVQLQMFEGMFPNVERIRAFYTVAKSFDDVVGKLVTYLIDQAALSPGSFNPTPGLLKVLAQLLDMTLKFDRAKMMHPEIQNDFSQYRRSLGKNQRHPGVPVNDIEANGVSMFIAQASPMISSLSTTLGALQKQGKDVARFLADFSHICCAYVMAKKDDTGHSVMALTAMTVAFVIYDNINPVGVFGKGTMVDLRNCVGQIKALPDVENRGILCDTLHYSTRSFDKAPDYVKRILEAR